MTPGYELEGAGAIKVIVMHNWMSTLRSYDAVRPLLDTRAFTYAFMDHRGYGLSRALAGANTATEAARDVIDLADALGWQKFHVIGHSMSGMIAQRVSLDARDRVRSVVAVTPVPATGVPLDAEGAALFKGTATSDEQWTTVARMMTSDRLPDRWYARELEHFRAGVEPAAYLRFLAMWTATDFSAEMTGLVTPALVVLGSHDFMAFSESAMRQTLGRWYADCKFELVEGSGHHPMSETPARFVSVVERFLRAQG